MANLTVDTSLTVRVLQGGQNDEGNYVVVRVDKSLANTEDETANALRTLAQARSLLGKDHADLTSYGHKSDAEIDAEGTDRAQRLKAKKTALRLAQTEG